MKKIEDAAWSYSPGTLDRIVQQRLDFIAGARYVLRQLTSESAIKAFADAVEEMDDQDVDQTPLEEIATALCAVRKEIEGE